MNFADAYELISGMPLCVVCVSCLVSPDWIEGEAGKVSRTAHECSDTSNTSENSNRKFPNTVFFGVGGSQ